MKEERERERCIPRGRCLFNDRYLPTSGSNYARTGKFTDQNLIAVKALLFQEVLILKQGQQ